jgi:hypothetical protein
MDPYDRIFGFLDRSSYFFFQVAPQLNSRGWVDPVPVPLLLRKSGSAGSRTRTSGSVARNSDRPQIGNTKYLYAFATVLFSCREPTLFHFQFLRLGWDEVHLIRRPLFGVLYQARMIDDECGAVGAVIGRGNFKLSKKIFPSASLSTTSPTWPDVVSNPRTTAVGNQRLAAWAIAQPPLNGKSWGIQARTCDKLKNYWWYNL